MENGRQVRATTRADRRNYTEKDHEDDMDAHKEDFVAKMNEVVVSSWRRKGKSDFQTKKNAIVKRAREDNGQISREALVTVHDVRAALEEVVSRCKRDRSMGGWISVLPRRDDAMDSLIKELGAMSTEVSPMRSTVINSASSTLQEQQDFYEESRRKICRGIKTYVEIGIEQQRIATDASELIRHYNVLLQPGTSK